MNKKQLAKALSKKSHLSPTQAETLIDSMLEEITSQLENGNEVNLSGFGKFSVKVRPAREGIDPRDPSKTYPQPERKLAKFKPGKNLKTMLISGQGSSSAAPEEDEDTIDHEE